MEANSDMTSWEPAPASRTPEDLIFSLDIGTRTVVGIVAEQRSDGFRILDYEQIEHPGRAMTDGQVEDIGAVSAIVGRVKQRLEERLGTTLHNAAVAAAGRTLRTVRTKLERQLPPDTAIDRDFVLGMESEAIEQAQQTIQNNDAPVSMRFYFVGYSIVQYAMDDMPVASLLGHTCSKATVELIAAFLPFSVIESLYASVEGCGLDVVSLTLEPIAAMNVLIPPELRLLNLALVDIGAGTSDIAVCRDGAVCAYEMATIAGDEITEAIIKNCLVAFETAEQLKRALSGPDETFEYEDVLCAQHRISRHDLFAAIEPAVDALAKTIAERILACNGEVPAAVFVIGGGSQIPGLGERLSTYLKLDPSNISAGRTRPLRGVISDFSALSSPEYVTPIGIGLTSVSQHSFQFWGVSVNGKPLKLLITREIRMIDLLLMAGYQTTQILGRTGRNLSYYVDGAQQLIKGGLPTHALLRCNGNEASVDTLVYPGDAISFEPAENGSDARRTLGEIVSEEAAGTVNLCGHDYRIGVWAEINDKYAPPETEIQPQDRITSHCVWTLGELCADCRLNIDPAQLFCDGEPLAADFPLCGGMTITLQGAKEPDMLEAFPEQPLEEMAAAQEAQPPAEDALTDAPHIQEAAAFEAVDESLAAEDAVFAAPQTQEETKSAEATRYDFGGDDETYYDEEEFDEEDDTWSAPPSPLEPEPVPESTLSLTLNGEPMYLPINEEHPRYYVMNLLGCCGLDLQNPEGVISMQVNGENAAFSRALNEGDAVEIGWK